MILKIYLIKDDPLDIVEIDWQAEKSYVKKNSSIKYYLSIGYVAVIKKRLSARNHHYIKCFYSPNNILKIKVFQAINIDF